MIGSGVSTDSMMAASFGIIDFIDSTASTTLTTSTMSSLSATSVFHGGGVGAGVLGRVGAGATHTGITAGTAIAMPSGYSWGIKSNQCTYLTPRPERSILRCTSGHSQPACKTYLPSVDTEYPRC